jgi:hypothetical protein
MVTGEDKPSIYDIVYVILFLINIFVFVYAQYHLFNNYSEVKFIYLTFSILFWMVGVLYYNIGYKLSGSMIHVFSILFAVRVVS